MRATFYYFVSWAEHDLSPAWLERQEEIAAQLDAQMAEARAEGDRAKIAEALVHMRQATDQAVIEGAAGYLLTIWQMAICRELMWERDMLDLDAEPPGGPDPHAYGLDKMPIVPLSGFAEGSARQRLYAAAEHARTAAAPRIPAYKLESPHGWRVTPSEIRASLEAYEAWLREDGGRDADLAEASLRPGGLSGFEGVVEDTLIMLGVPISLDLRVQVSLSWWPIWISFLTGAAEHGGFDVTWVGAPSGDEDDNEDDNDE